MEHLIIQTTEIKLKSKPGVTVTRAVLDAIRFCNTENLDSIELEHEGFLFDIEKDSSVIDKVKEYELWIARKFVCSCGKPDAIRLCEGVEYCMKCGDRLRK